MGSSPTRPTTTLVSSPRARRVPGYRPGMTTDPPYIEDPSPPSPLPEPDNEDLSGPGNSKDVDEHTDDRDRE